MEFKSNDISRKETKKWKAGFLNYQSSISGGLESPHSDASGGQECPHSDVSGGQECPHSDVLGGQECPHSDASGGQECPHSDASGGQECPRSDASGGLEYSLSDGKSFFNPYRQIQITSHQLPHWQQDGVWVFVTWRLGDSLPKAKLDQWNAERDVWRKFHPEPWDAKTEEDYHKRFSHQIDEWLDQGNGSCILMDPANARIVADALRHFDGKRYEIASFVVMPNHVHVLFRPLGNHTLPGILRSWKGFTAHAINLRLESPVHCGRRSIGTVSFAMKGIFSRC